MRYGQTTSAITRVGRDPQMAAAIARAGYSPAPQHAFTGVGRGDGRAPLPANARVGQTQLAPAAPPQQVKQVSTLNGNTSSIIFMGTDAPVNGVPAGLPPAPPGILNVTFTPCEPVVIVDFEITDPSGQLLITNIFTCRSPIFEGGFLSVAALANASTSRPGWMKALQRLVLMQTVPLTITFANATANVINVQGGLLVVPIEMTQTLPPGTEAALARYDASMGA